MKAWISDRYGSPDVMRLEEIDLPKVADDQVLVRIQATSVNAWDWHMLRGKPYIARLGEGFRRPKLTTLGLDVAGTVEAVGHDVTHVAPDDRVFGSRAGAFAEYVSGKNMVPMPANLTFEQAAAVPTAGMTALQGLRDIGALRAGERVLVNGAGGGVGSFAVQIARAMGAEVTAVTSTENLPMMGSIGADRVIDYRQEDFMRGVERYDLILDAGGNRSLLRLRRSLAPGGRLVMVAPGRGQWLGPLIRIAGALVLTRFGDRTLRAFLARVSRDDLMALKGLIEDGKVTPVVGATFPFEAVPDAIRHVEEGASCGKTVISVGSTADG